MAPQQKDIFDVSKLCYIYCTTSKPVKQPANESSVTMQTSSGAKVIEVELQIGLPI